MSKSTKEPAFMAPDNSAEGKRQFRSALGQFATGVAVITARDPEGRDIGMTVNSFSSVSLDPPLILWSIGHESKSLDSFSMHTPFAVNVLSADQEAVAKHFAASGRDQFTNTPATGLPLARGLGDVPLLGGCLTYFECQLDALLPGGDHTILVGKVERFASMPGAPLLFHSGKFHKIDS